MAPHSSTLAWKIPWTEEPGRLQSMESLRVQQDWATSLSLFTFMHWRWKWQPIQCSCLENHKDVGAWWAAVYVVTQSRPQLKWFSIAISHCVCVYHSSVQFSRSVMSDSATPWTAAHQASLSTTNSQSLLKLMSIKSVMPSNHLILCCPLLPLSSIFPIIRVFSYESALRIRWPKYWSFSFNISPSHEHLGLTSFRKDWLDLLAIQGTLKNLLQHHSSKASILRCSHHYSPPLTSIHEYWKNHSLD